MKHVSHIANNKATLDIRWQILKLIREFFWANEFVEVESPTILKLPGQEPYLSPMPVGVKNERDEVSQGYLHTTPEYTMKKMLAANYKNIFYLGKVFRGKESFGGTHNPEFTIAEWYRVAVSMEAIMDDCEGLFHSLASELKLSGEHVLRKPVERIHMRDLWQREVGANLDEYLSLEAMATLCREKGYAVVEGDAYEDLFYKIFLNEIEPKLGQDGATIVHHYPMQMASLAKRSETDDKYAERFEVYVEGLELGNAFTELTDAGEQRERLVEEQEQRRTLGQEVFDVDEEFLSAVEHMPESAGIALGVDRLAMIATGCKNIDSVLPLPTSLLFND